MRPRPLIAAIVAFALAAPPWAAAREPARSSPGLPEASAPGPLSPEQEAAIAPIWYVALENGCRRLAALHPNPRNTQPPGSPASLMLDLAAIDAGTRISRINIPDANEPVRLRNQQYFVVTSPRLPLPLKLYPNFITCRTYLQADRERVGLPRLPYQNPLEAD